MSKPWIGVDFDGTLATYDHWRGPTHTGQPIWPMVQRVKRWLDVNLEVRVFTARAADPEAAAAVARWCERYIGQSLLVTATKDYDMMELWDDRAVQVEFNTGKRLSND